MNIYLLDTNIISEPTKINPHEKVLQKLADNLEKYLCKGKGIAVDGYLKVDTWEKDGQKKSRTYVVADTVKLLGGKTDDSETNANASANAQKTTNTEQNDLGFKEDPVF